MVYSRRARSGFRRRRHVSRKRPAAFRRRGAGYRTRRVRFNIPETKTLNYLSANNAMGAASSAFNNFYSSFFAPIVQGTADGNRIGHRIFAKYMKLNIMVETGSTFAANYPTGTCFRMVLVYDKGCNGSSPSASDVFSYLGTSGTEGFVQMPKNNINASRFRFLIDRTFCLSPGLMCPVMCNFMVPINRYVDYVSNGGTVSDLKRNNLSLWFIQDFVGGAPLTDFSLDWSYQLFYTDS